jgi:hypothetical protein
MKKLVGLIGLACALQGCGHDKGCTEMACGHSDFFGTTLRAAIPIPAASLQDARVKACRTAGCYDSDPLGHDAGTGALHVTMQDKGRSCLMEVQLPAINRLDVPEIETFSIAVTNPQGDTLFTASKSVAGRIYPNGKDCEKSGSAILQLSMPNLLA